MLAIFKVYLLYNPTLHNDFIINPIYSDVASLYPNIPSLYDNYRDYQPPAYTANFITYTYYQYYYSGLRYAYDMQRISYVYRLWTVKFKLYELRALDPEVRTFEDYMDKTDTQINRIYNIRNVSRNYLYTHGCIN